MPVTRDEHSGRGRGARGDCGRGQLAEYVAEGRGTPGRPTTVRTLERDGAKLAQSIEKFLVDERRKAEASVGGEEALEAEAEEEGGNELDELDEEENKKRMRSPGDEDGEEWTEVQSRSKRKNTSGSPGGARTESISELSSRMTAMLEIILKGQEETRASFKAQKEETRAALEKGGQETEAGNKELKSEMNGLAKRLDGMCDNWKRDKAVMEERIRSLEKEKEEWTEKEGRARREWEKKMLEKMAEKTEESAEKRREQMGPAPHEEERVRELERKIEKVEEDAERGEKEKRRRNVIIRGQDSDQAEDKEKTAKNAIEYAAGCDIELEELRVVNSARGSMVIAKMRK